ncbi:MAG TPA: GNAT family N-acetyltransferase, partial [Streptosporangiaceae bacterium]|nr:GNAT family N-acetyltransferase [Streptosporangiaceae bacterium]
MAEPISYSLLAREQAAEHAKEIAALAAEVYADPPFEWDEARVGQFARRFAVQLRQPGFALAEARSGDYLVGVAFGLPLRPSTDWWHQLTTTLPADVTTEHPGRSFAVAGLLVRAPWRRQFIGSSLHDELRSKRTEERALATILPAATAA